MLTVAELPKHGNEVSRMYNLALISLVDLRPKFLPFTGGVLFHIEALLGRLMQ
jgi:hypothetical protein